ncbi:HNH endonuclease [Rodentibacter trehalosifermentans]|uniref:HNH nuclease domain-containing protein n=1 Tax=Rodentibacter trehalosifermentans TaxID=1908263 RepID=A0A1V3IYG4_9PAST|nr:HNH endonuclease [Rodentibacter trehalosifermentans]OOF47190.1 hypothetical protein BKK51_00565 [Rodentibacter trehalosifermentans]OOF49485.1 hypothetical protein BKK52_02950 [Rodentibacter trehalosifermentans]OOF52469.1 hypothetical protein BKK53_05075 [Rodentibacter trehalosifermentans]
MKLSVDFSDLYQAVKKISDIQDIFTGDMLPIKTLQIDNFDTNLSSSKGIEVKLSDIEIKRGLLTYKGRHVLLFMPDNTYVCNQNGKSISDIKRNPALGNKYHIADCKTLQDMRLNNRIDKYHVQANLNNLFHIHNDKGEEDDVSLQVCKNCLDMLKYKGYSRSGDWKKKNEIFNNFNNAEFFEYYSAIFADIPDDIGQTKIGYAENWQEIANKVKKRANYCCQKCQLDLNLHPNLLHVHHINGVKQDNRPENLIPLCIECHSQQPMHQHMKEEAQKYSATIQLLRQKQLI